MRYTVMLEVSDNVANIIQQRLSGLVVADKTERGVRLCEMTDSKRTADLHASALAKDGYEVSVVYIPDVVKVERSSQISAVYYDANRLILEVTFKLGGVYEYLNVPRSVYAEFLAAESKGRFLNQHVKGVYEYQKIGEKNV